MSDTASVGDRVRGWFNRQPYTGTVTSIGPSLSSLQPEPRHITVREDNGTEYQTYSDAVEDVSRG